MHAKGTSLPDTQTQRPKRSKQLSGAARQARWTLAICLFLAALALVAPYRMLSLGLISSSVTLLVLGGLVWARKRRALRKQNAELAVIEGFIRRDATPSFVANADGQIRSANPAAHQQFEIDGFKTLAGVLKSSVANPGGILFRLQSRAVASGAAQEDIFTRAGHLRLCVHVVAEDAYVWRVDQLGERAPPRAAQEGQHLPMVMIGRSDAILFMNDAARRLIGSRVKGLDRLFNVLPVVPGVPTDLITSDGSQRVLVAEVTAGAGRRALYFLPVPEQAVSAQGWQAFEDLPVPLIKVAPDGKVKTFNRMAANLVGVALEDNVHLSNLMEGLGRSIADWINDTLAFRKVQKSEFLRLKRTDREVFVQVVLSHVLDEGEPSLVAVLHDATELKTLEAQFVQSQKMQAIGQLAGGVAHDFNNLLTAIFGNVSLASLAFDDDNPAQKYLRESENALDRASQLSHKLLTFAKGDSLSKEVLALNELIKNTVEFYATGSSIDVVFELGSKEASVNADHKQLEQVFSNLTVNAVESMGADGRLSISIREVDARYADAIPAQEGRYAAIEFSDTGSGISPENLEHIFDLYFSTKEFGSGLGLATVFSIVKKHEGFIDVESELGEGSTFTIYLPATARKPKATPLAAEEPPLPSAQQSDRSVLVMDDEESIRVLLKEVLSNAGYLVDEASEGREALNKYLQSIESGKVYDCVVMDLTVREGMGGREAIQELLQIDPDAKVIVASGYGVDPIMANFKNYGFAGAIEKPFSLPSFIELVKSLSPRRD